MADDAVFASPPSPPPPAMQPPSDSSPPPPSSPPPDTPASAAQTPSLPDTPASLDPDTPFSDATPADASDADTPALAPPDALAPDVLGDDDGISAPGAARKHMTLAPPAPPSKKSKKKGVNSVWTRPASRKGKKKAKQPGGHTPGGLGGAGTGSRPKPSVAGEEEFLLVPAPRLAAERSDDAAGLPVLLSRVFKSERIELSDDRLTASSSKGYRMVRATRGVAAGAWYFEVRITHLGPSGHTRLGWATNRADLQTPVGYDAYGFGYRDIDGAKVHRAWRDKYADEGYGEGDVIGFYISLPDGERYEPKQPHLIQYKGMPFHVQVPKEEQKTQDPVPGSQICYFKNGVCQGIAFKDIPGGRYYPAASLYTLPNEPNCVVKFNFGPDFDFFPQDFGGMPIPQPMSEVPHQEYEPNNDKPVENSVVEKTS